MPVSTNTQASSRTTGGRIYSICCSGIHLDDALLADCWTRTLGHDHFDQMAKYMTLSGIGISSRRDVHVKIRYRTIEVKIDAQVFTEVNYV
jgi:hypothetical protein